MKTRQQIIEKIMERLDKKYPCHCGFSPEKYCKCSIEKVVAKEFLRESLLKLSEAQNEAVMVEHADGEDHVEELTDYYSGFNEAGRLLSSKWQEFISTKQ